jgi:hypothetical protein
MPPGAERCVEEARACLASTGAARASARWESELACVPWRAARNKILTIQEVQEAAARLTAADNPGSHAVPNRTRWQGALIRARQSGIAVRDTLFVEPAARQRSPRAGFDAPSSTPFRTSPPAPPRSPARNARFRAAAPDAVRSLNSAFGWRRNNRSGSGMRPTLNS